MTTDTTTLTAWLLEQIAADEADARSVLDQKAYFRQVSWGWFDSDFGDFHLAEYGKDGAGLPARVVATCAAHRAIVELAFESAQEVDSEWGDAHTAAEIRAGKCADHGNIEALKLVRTLAAIYADRPGFRNEWR